MQRLAAAALVVAPWSSSSPPSAHAALSVMPHHAEAIVTQLRSAILVHEKDLVGPVPPTSCSSLDDGPFCDPFGRIDVDFRSDWGDATKPPSVVTAEAGEPSLFVVDGILSNRLQSRNKEALDWSVETYRTFSTLVSRVISESISGNKETVAEVTVAQEGGGAHRSSRGQPLVDRTASQCFRIAFDQLLPSERIVPSNFTAGLPRALAASWEGLWEPEVTPTMEFEESRTKAVENELPSWRTRLVLRTALGYIRFAQAVVLRRFTVGVPIAFGETVSSKSAKAKPWSQKGLVCGRLQGKEQWCVALKDLFVASASDSESNGAVALGADNADRYSPLRFVDISNSLTAIDEVAILSTPDDGLRVGMIEVAATIPTHPLHQQPHGQRRVVMLRRPPGRRGGQAWQLEPVLATVSRDAAMWDLNDLIRNNMELRMPTAGSDFAVLTQPQGRTDSGGSSSSGSTNKPSGAAQKIRAKTGSKPAPAIGSLQGMLRGLKANIMKPPLGVSYARLKKEVSALLASTAEIQDEDVLVHSRLETLLQQRLREKCLDGLLVLQDVWQELVSDYHSGAVKGERGEKLADILAMDDSTSASVAPDTEGSSADESQSVPASSQSQLRTSHVEVADDDVEIAPDDESPREWVDGVDEAMSRASASLAKKSSEARLLQEQLMSAGGQFQFNMNLEDGTVELTSREDLSPQLQDLVAKAMASAMSNGVGVATATMSAEDLQQMQDLGELNIENLENIEAFSGDTGALEDLSASLAEALAENKDMIAELFQTDDVEQGAARTIDVKTFTIGADGSTTDLAEFLRKRLQPEADETDGEV